MKFLTKTTNGTPQLVDGINSFTGVANQIPQTNGAGYLDANLLEVSTTAGNIVARNTDGLFVPGQESFTAEMTGTSLTQNVNTLSSLGNILIFNTLQIPTLFGTTYFSYNSATGEVTTNFTGRIQVSARVSFGVANGMQLQGFVAKNAVRVGSLMLEKVNTSSSSLRASVSIGALSTCIPGDVFTVRMSRAPTVTVTAATVFAINPTLEVTRLS